MSTRRVTVVALIAAAWLLVAAPVSAQTARERYEAAQTSEATARQALERTPGTAGGAARAAAVTTARRAILRYEALVRRFPTSGYADNALWQAADLSRALFERFERPEDRTAALKYYAWLAKEYPASSLGRQAKVAGRTLSGAAVTRTVAALPPARPPAPSPPAPPPAPPAAASPALTPLPSASSKPAPAGVTLTRIERVVLGGLARVMLYVDGEVTFAHDVIGGPPRAYVDLQGVSPVAALADSTMRYEDSAVRTVRVGRQAGATRVVVDLDGAPRVSVFTLANPYRVVIDADTAPAATTAAGGTNDSGATSGPAPPAVDAGTASPGAPAPSAAAAPASTPPLDTAPLSPLSPIPAGFEGTLRVDSPPTTAAAPLAALAVDDAPRPPAVNGDGTFSLARQLGLGVSRIVIDAGHGGHDPGTLLSGSNEATIVLDVALRLEKLLKKEPGLDVVLTRRTNVFVPLEERTAIANREGADLFLSIHANASRNVTARGIETYYLSFASNPEAEAVAARENSTSARDMHNLPGIVRAIALNTKLDESRDLATLVQQAMASRLPGAGAEMKNRGVKKAPFVVLIGAGMPSILTEIGFLTNKNEATLLKTPAYRQKVAEALHASVMSYRRALKRQTAVATAAR